MLVFFIWERVHCKRIYLRLTKNWGIILEKFGCVILRVVFTHFRGWERWRCWGCTTNPGRISLILMTISGQSMISGEGLVNIQTGHSDLLNYGRLLAHSGCRENNLNYLTSLTLMFPIKILCVNIRMAGKTPKRSFMKTGWMTAFGQELPFARSELFIWHLFTLSTKRIYQSPRNKDLNKMKTALLIKMVYVMWNAASRMN